MSDGRRFEDKVSINDFINMPEKELLASIYIQTLKTNGTVRDHEKEIDDLKTCMKEKMDWGMFKRLSIVMGLLISALTVPSLVLNIIKFITLTP